MNARTANPSVKALRIGAAFAAMLALGGSINAVNAADAIVVPAATAPDSASDLPRFQPSPAAFTESFVHLGPAASVEVTDGAVDITAIAPAERVLDEVPGGMASWYGAELAGRRTANGERFNPDMLTAAHRTLPLGTKLLVTYQGRSVVVRISDRGPYAHGRVIDLSRAAADQIGMRRAGSGRVELARIAG